MSLTTLTQDELDAISYKAATAAAASAKAEVNARFDDLEKKAAIVIGVGAVVWFLSKRR